MADTKKEEQQVELTEVVTQTDIGYKLPNGEVVALPAYLVWLGNLMYKVSKSVA